MSLCKLHVDNRTLIIIITSLIISINFRASYHYVNNHMDIGYFYSLSYDPLLLLIKNIFCILFFVLYYTESKIIKAINKDIANQKINLNNKEEVYNINNEDDNGSENVKLGVIDSMVILNDINKRKYKFLFGLKTGLLIIFIYVCEDISFITINNHILDRLICPIRNAFSLFAILFLSGIIYHKKIEKTQIKN